MVLKQSNWVRRHKNALYGVVKYLYTEHVNTKINISVTVYIYHTMSIKTLTFLVHWILTSLRVRSVYSDIVHFNTRVLVFPPSTVIHNWCRFDTLHSSWVEYHGLWCLTPLSKIFQLYRGVGNLEYHELRVSELISHLGYRRCVSFNSYFQKYSEIFTYLKVYALNWTICSIKCYNFGTLYWILRIELYVQLNAITFEHYIEFWDIEITNNWQPTFQSSAMCIFFIFKEEGFILICYM